MVPIDVFRIIGFDYDDNGNLTFLTPSGRPAHEFAYTEVDLASVYTPPNPQPPLIHPSTQYTYNLDKQVKQVTRPDGGTITFEYDDGGRLQTQTLPPGQGQLGYSYDPITGNLMSITGPGNNTLSFTYDGSLLTSQTWSGEVSGVVSRTYDNDFRVASQSVNGGHTVTYEYDDDGLMIRAGDMTITRDPDNGLVTGTTLGGVTDERTYNGFGEIETYTAKYNGTPIFAVTYGRDALGRITHKSESVEGGAPVDTYYAYDPAGRLYRVCADEACTTIQSEYHYDLNGNRIACEPPPNQTACTFTATQGALLSAEYDNQDRLLSTQHTAQTTAYTYTTNGELLTKSDATGTTTYVYDALGNLRSATLPNGDVIDYVIDGKNRRVGKKLNGTPVQRFLWDEQLRIVAELDGNGEVVSRLINGGKTNVPEYMVRNGVAYRFLTDHLGSPRRTIRVTDGASTQEVDYDEFGVAVEGGATSLQPFGFAGGLQDSTVDLVRFGVRDYSPQAGRWTTPDPIRFSGGSANLYQYALGNPIGLVDPSGLTQADIDLAIALVAETQLDLDSTGTVTVRDLAAFGDQTVGLTNRYLMMTMIDDRYLSKLTDDQATDLSDTIIHEAIHRTLHPKNPLQNDEINRDIYDETLRRLEKIIKEYLKRRKKPCKR